MDRAIPKCPPPRAEAGAARQYAPPKERQFDSGILFRRQSGHLRQSMDPKIAADLRPSADAYVPAVRTSMVAGSG